MEHFGRDAPNAVDVAIPVYTTNMLAKMNVPDSLINWAIYGAGTVEINVKQKGGLLQDQLDRWKPKGKRIGVFQAIPDGPGAGQFYDSDGHCCYTLKDKFSSYNGVNDTADNRGDINYLMDQGFGLITTDDPSAAMATLIKNKRRQKPNPSPPFDGVGAATSGSGT